MIKRVTQVEAKHGACIETFDSQRDFTAAAERLERILIRENCKRQLVYVVIPFKKRIQWQVFLMP